MLDAISGEDNEFMSDARENRDHESTPERRQTTRALRANRRPTVHVICKEVSEDLSDAQADREVIA